MRCSLLLAELLALLGAVRVYPGVVYEVVRRGVAVVVVVDAVQLQSGLPAYELWRLALWWQQTKSVNINHPCFSAFGYNQLEKLEAAKAA